MKVELSVDQKEFIKEITELRSQLNSALADGIIDDDFHKRLEELTEKEERLLKDLLPYYREYIPQAGKVSMSVRKIKKLGAVQPESYIQMVKRITDKLFITSSISGEIRFLLVENSSHGELTYQWGQPIEDIKEAVSFVHVLNGKTLFLFGVRGGCYKLLLDTTESLPSAKKIQLEDAPLSHKSDGFGRCAVLSENTIATEWGEDSIAVLEISSSGNITVLPQSAVALPDWIVMESMGENTLAVGTDTGELLIIKADNQRLKIVARKQVLTQRIRCIAPLDSHGSILVAGDKGSVSILYIANNSIENGVEYSLKGNLFSAVSANGTGVILSDDGIIYLLEENFGKWRINESVTMEDVFFISINAYILGEYLLLDLDNEVNLLEIDRVDTPESLWSLPLYI